METTNDNVTGKTTRTPRNLESITKGALSLELCDRIALVKELKASIQTEVDEAKSRAEAADKMSKDI